MNNQNNENGQWQLLVLFLKEIAEEKGMTQEQIAQETGMIQSAISRFFALRFQPKLDTFLQIANAVKVNFFFEDRESKTDLNICLEKAMAELGRRVDKLPKN